MTLTEEINNRITQYGKKILELGQIPPTDAAYYEDLVMHKILHLRMKIDELNWVLETITKNK